VERDILSGVRVVDFGQYIAGPLTAMVLADYGATVIHVDPPGGTMLNHPVNAFLMRGKQRITLDLKKAEGKETARRLAASADVVIENFRPGVMERLGLGAAELREGRPDLIYCSIPGFSADDKARKDIRAWEGIVMAEAGLYRAGRFPLQKDQPVFYSLPIASCFGAFIAVHSILAALIAFERTGRGQRIEIPLYDACFEAAGIFNGPPKAKPAKSPKLSMGGLMGYPTRDGRYVQLSPPTRGIVNLWNYLLPGEDIEEVTPEIQAKLAEKFSQLTMLEWEKFGQEELHAGVAPVLSTEEWLHDGFARSSGSVCEVDDPLLGRTVQPGRAVMVNGRTGPVQARHTEDGDRAAVLAQLEAEIEKRAGRKGTDAESISCALEGVKVLDFCQILAGPICGRILSEYGASVIKINNPRREENPTAMAGHECVNNGKATVFLDLKSEQDRALLKDLIAEADVFHCNFTPSALKRLGLDEKSVREINRDIVYSQLNVHSLGGARGEYRGHEELGEAISGMTMRMSGDEKGAALPVTYCDNSTGCIAAIGVLLAILHRLKTGEGLAVHAALSRSAGYLQIPYMLDYAGKVWDEPAGKDVLGWGPFDRLYRTASGWIYLCCGNGKEDLAGLPGFEELPDDPAEAGRIMEAKLMEQPAEEWIRRFSGTGVTVRQNRAFAQDAMAEGYAVQRGLSVTGMHRGLGQIRTTGCSPRLSMTPARTAFLVAAPGSDTEEIRRAGWNYSVK